MGINRNGNADKSRRRFVTGVASGAAASVLAGSAHAQATGDGPYDTIVIGGGFAGVTAARDAAFRGLRTLLLEARPRLGGRTYTTSMFGHDLELGGTWLGWSQPHVWAEVSRYKMSIAESAAAAAGEYIWKDANGRLQVTDPGSYFQAFESATNAFYEPARDAFPRPFNPAYVEDLEGLDAQNARQAVDALDLPPDERALLMSFAAVNGHSDPSESSYLDQLRWFALGDFSLANMWDNLGRYRLSSGTKALLDRMQADSPAEVRLNSPVAALRQDSDGVRVETRGGAVFEARTAIVAAPLNCLGDIDFEPRLSSTKLQVAEERHTGAGTKVYVRIRGKRPIFMGHGTEDMPLCFVWTEYDDADSQLLVGFGKSPVLLDVNDDEAVHAAIHNFIPDAEILESYGYDWNEDPYAKGTWTMYRPGWLTEHLSELQRPEGNVYFAGSDIADGWRGFIDGAIESGARAASQVASHLAEA